VSSVFDVPAAYAGQKLMVAVIGAGHWGWQHARVWSERPDTELCAIYSRSAERADERARAFGARAYTDVAELVERERPDLLSVCLPNKGHFATTRELIRIGVPLLVEKPLVFDLAEADELLAEAARRGLFFAINFNHRYARPTIMAKAAIESGRLGDLVFATWRFGGEGGRCFDHENLIETQCHAFDTLEHLLGPIRALSAEMTDLTGKGYSTLAMSLRFASGAIGSLVGSYDSSYAYTDAHRLEINGTQGRVLVADTVKRYEFQAARSEVAEIWQAGYFNDGDREFKRTFDAYADDLVAALRTGAQPPVHASAGRRALVLARAAIAAFETGRRVEVPI
jgi:myo-inositol 2-dehydrogenase / D-chiro-inositol 1-dehydrogenase